MTECFATTLANPYHYTRKAIYYLRVRAKGAKSDDVTTSMRTSNQTTAEEITADILKRLYELHSEEPSATWEELKKHIQSIAIVCLGNVHGDASKSAYEAIRKKPQAPISIHEGPGGRVLYVTPLGVVTDDSAIHEADYGDARFFLSKPRGEYRANLVIPLHQARPLIKKIVAVHKANYKLMKEEFRRNLPTVAAARKQLKPYEGVMPLLENGDGTVTLKFRCYASYPDLETRAPIKKPLEVVDSLGTPIMSVPSIAGGSELKVKFSIFPYGWSNTLGAAVRLTLEGVMLVKLVQPEKLSGWENEVVVGGYVTQEPSN